LLHYFGQTFEQNPKTLHYCGIDQASNATQSALEDKEDYKNIKGMRSMVALNIRSGRVISEVLGAMSASNHGTKVLVLRVYAKRVHHLFNYGMNACDDQVLVKNCIEELFSRIGGRPDLLQDEGSVDTNLFKMFRRLLIRHIASLKRKPTSDIRENFFSFEPSMMRGLTSLQREALFLKFRGGLNYREIASVLDVTIDQLQTQISKAVDVLLHKK
jgi:DNA-directed RNA polymerase specialized sigma24 family protein